METPPGPQAIYEAIGNAVAQWSAVEDYLTFTLQTALGNAHPFATEAAFQSIVSFSGKLDFLNAAITVAVRYRKNDAGDWCDISLGNKIPILADWKTLHKLCKDLSVFRNRIAHGEVSFYPVDKGRREWIVAPGSLTLKRKLSITPYAPPPDSLTAQQIKDITQKFGELISLISAFDVNLKAALAQSPTSL